MRILFVSYAYPNAAQPQLGTFNRTMIAGLSQRHALQVVAPVPFLTAWRHRRTLAGGPCVVAGVAAAHPTYYYVPKLFRAHSDCFLWWSVRRTLTAAIREFQPDVVLSYWAHPDGAVAVRAAHAAGVPAVVMAGGSDVLILGRRGPRRAAVLKALREADAVVTVNQDLANTLCADGLDAGRLHVVPRGIDQSLFHPGDRLQARRELGLPVDRPVLVGVGRLVEVKDWPTWLAACGELAACRPSCHILGGGPLDATLKRLIRDRGLSELVQIHGPQSQATLACWYRAADLTVLSSRSEGVPNVLLETIRCGGSFAATRVGGIPEIADPVYDRLVPPQNPRALADAIRDRLDQPPPHGWPRRFEPDTQAASAQRLARVLESVIAQTKPNRPIVAGRQLVMS